MVVVPGMKPTLGGNADPRESMDFQRPEIERLFAMATEGRLPRNRDLKPWEPQRLNERHLAMVMMRASGVKQRTIAEAFEATDANVSIVLNHPDAELLLQKLQSMRATQPSAIEERLQALSERAVGTLEDLFSPFDETPTVKKAPMAFKLLEMNGYARPRQVESQVNHTFSANPRQLDALTRALRESNSIEQAEILAIQTVQGANEVLSGPPGGVVGGQPAPSYSSEAAAPSSGGSQEVSDG